MAEQTNQDQQAAAAQAVQDPGTQRQSAPWDADLSRLFEDEAARSTASDYMRENVQPRMTQLEQQYAQTQEARALWDDLQTRPMEVFVQMAHDMFGEDAANKVLDTVQQQLTSDNPAEQQAAAETIAAVTQTAEAPQQARLTPDEQEAIKWANQQRIETAYNSELEGVKARNPDIPAAEVDKFIHPWVNMAGGNFDRAMGLYRDYRTQYGVPATSEQIAAAQAPETLGGEGQVSSTAPVNEVVTMEDAYKDLARSLKANREAPRTVGSV